MLTQTLLRLKNLSSSGGKKYIFLFSKKLHPSLTCAEKSMNSDSSLRVRLSRFLQKTGQSGAVWFFLATAMPPLSALALGPLILDKVGLEEYAIIAIALYFFNQAYSYSDYSSYTHLLVVFSRNDTHRKVEIGNAIILKLVILSFFFLALLYFSLYKQREDNLYQLLAVFMVGIPFSQATVDWYFIARKRYQQLFWARLFAVGQLSCLTVIWCFSSYEASWFVPLIALVSGGTGLACLLILLGRATVMEGVRTLGHVTPRTVANLAYRLLPTASVLLLNPFFLAYALPWYSMIESDPKSVGSFSIAYRIVIGMSALVSPLVYFMIPRVAGSNELPSLRKALAISGLAAAGLWVAGMPVLWVYFRFSGVETRFFYESLYTFSVLMVGLFCLCVRSPYVGRWLVAGKYRDYFLIVAASCLPVLIVSGFFRENTPAKTIVWLACVPDLLATIGFVVYSRLRAKSSRL